MNELSFQSVRAANQAREDNQQRRESRQRNLLVLVWDFLSEHGYVDSAKSLERETNLDFQTFEVCDNIDLETVLQEFESYYYVKFQRYPKVTKKVLQAGDGKKGKTAATCTRYEDRELGGGRNMREIRQFRATASRPPENMHSAPVRSSSNPSLPQLSPNPSPAPNYSSFVSQLISVDENGAMQPKNIRKKNVTQTVPVPVVNGITNGKTPLVMNGVMNEASNLQELAVQGTGRVDAMNVKVKPPASEKPRPGQIIDIRAMLNDATRLGSEYGGSNDDKILKPLGGYVGYNSEWRELAQVILRDIYLQNPNVSFNDIIGLDDAKRLVKEAVVYPIKYPQLFTGILSPWKGLLLYGPPGTGKTLLAKAVATECKTTFFNISASSIISKWRGDSEKLVRILFELARYYAPSTIFLDEIEALMSHRGSGGGEHEGSRRMKTEILVQMDGLAKSNDLVFLLAASNLPWELDHAMLRRLEKRILVGLPTLDARKKMFISHLPPDVLKADDNRGLGLTADLDYYYLAQKTEGYSGSDIRLVCKEAAMRPVRKIFNALETHTEGDQLNITLDTVTTNDVEAVLQHTKPSARQLQQKYEAFQKEYESV